MGLCPGRTQVELHDSPCQPTVKGCWWGRHGTAVVKNVANKFRVELVSTHQKGSNCHNQKGTYTVRLRIVTVYHYRDTPAGVTILIILLLSIAMFDWSILFWWATLLLNHHKSDPRIRRTQDGVVLIPLCILHRCPISFQSLNVHKTWRVYNNKSKRTHTQKLFQQFTIYSQETSSGPRNLLLNNSQANL